MKLDHIRIGKQEYPLALSITAMSDLEEKFGSLEDFGQMLSNESAKLSDRFLYITDALQICMEAGSVAAAELGEPAPDLPQVDISALTGLDDMPAATEKLFALMNIQDRREVEALPPKNASPTPDTPTEMPTAAAI